LGRERGVPSPTEAPTLGSAGHYGIETLVPSPLLEMVKVPDDTTGA
jgi:hypothetical protein